MTQTTASELMEICQLSSVEMDPTAIPEEFEKLFSSSELVLDWTKYHDEPEATPFVRTKLENILTKGIGSRVGFKVLDLKSAMLFNKIPFGNVLLSGKTDIVVVPYKSAIIGCEGQLRLIYDLKTPERYQKSYSQQIGEQLVACRKSQHPVMVVFSDQSTAATITVVKGRSLEIASNVTLLQAAFMMCEFLKLASPEPAYRGDRK
eukprot:Lithocolla_globosa_v1_NODE_141_length_5757_cov_121.254121.p3 type:complete len:205 gc:universal NODE_141_length_5757_cov_121.254121:815-1429(+)